MFNKKVKVDLYTCDKGFFVNDKPSLQMDTPDWLKNIKSSTDVVDKETQGKIDIVKQRLIRNYGYNEESATDVLNFVASIFARGDTKSEK